MVRYRRTDAIELLPIVKLLIIAPSSGPSLSHIAACSFSAAVLGAAQLTNHVFGVGIGGSGGIGAAFFGLYGSVGLQVVADPQGNAGLALNGTFSFTGIGIGAQGGGQVSLSTAKNIGQLSGVGGDLGGSVAYVGLDGSHSPAGPTTVTATGGPGVGARISGAATASFTKILSSTNCKDMFPK